MERQNNSPAVYHMLHNFQPTSASVESQVKFILPQRYKHKTHAGNSERPHGHLSQPHPKQ